MAKADEAIEREGPGQLMGLRASSRIEHHQPTASGGKKAPGEALIDALAKGLAVFLDFVVPAGLALAPFVFGILWIGFAVALVASQGRLDATWEWTRGLPLVLQGLVWLLFLPVMLGLWIYQTSWPFILRIVLIAGLAVWSIAVFLPRRVFQR